MQSTRTLVRNCLYGININDGIVCFAPPSVTEDNWLNSVPLKENIPDLLNSILYNICNVALQQEDIVKARIYDQHLESGLKARWNSSGCIWSSFLLAKNSETKTSYHSSFVVKFDDEDKENTQEYTRDVIDFVKSFGIPSISKLVPTMCKSGYTVDIISCESKTLDQFDVFPVKYSGHHPLFDFGHSIYKSIDETRRIIDLADLHLNLPEIKTLKHLVEEYSNKNFPSVDAYPNPFIVVEGLDGVGKTTLANNLKKRLGAQLFHTPPDTITKCRELMVKQCQPVCRAFYTLGNYLMAETVKDALVTSPVVLDRFWHSSASYAIATEAKCGREENIPPKANSIYQWPEDLLKPSAVVFLELNERDRIVRIRERGAGESKEEMKLTKSQFLRQRLVQAYKNMENPSCIIIDASKSREEVCDSVIGELKSRNILTH